MLHSTSFRRSAAVAAVAALTAVAAAPAQAKSSHAYKSVIESATLSTGNGYPGAGGTAILAGTWATNAFGQGAVVDHITITGQSGSTISFKGTEVCFVAKGTFRDTFTGTDTVASDGSQKVVTSGRFIGGTGAYKGAKGKFKYSGAAPSGSNVVHGRSSGTIVY
jgi:hypothetical protein